MHKLPSGQLFRWASRIVTAIAVLAGVRTAPTRAQAAATYNVLAGLSTSYGVDVLAYGPQTLKVHRGDTVTWQFMAAHNVRFDEKPLPLIITSNVDGKTLTEINPQVLSPNGKSGDVHRHGANSGMPLGRPSGTPTC